MFRYFTNKKYYDHENIIAQNAQSLIVIAADCAFNSGHILFGQ